VTDTLDPGVALPANADAGLELLYGLAEAVDRCRTIEEVFDTTVDGLRAGIGVGRASLLLPDEHGVLRFLAWCGLSDSCRLAVEGLSPWRSDTGMPRPIVVPDVELDGVLQPFREALAGDGIGSLALVPLLREGRLIGTFLLGNDAPHDFTKGELRLAEAIASHVAIAIDRLRVEEELRVSRDELRTILRQVGDGVTVQDASGAVIYANDAAARLIGVGSPEELMGMPPAELIQRFELMDETGNPFPLDRLPGRLALGGESAEAVVRWRTVATGEERWSIVRATPIHGEDGNVRLAVNSLHDITELRRAQDRFRLLSTVSDLLTSSLDYHATLCAVTRSVVPGFCDFATVWLAEGDRLVRLGFTADDPDRGAALAQLPTSYRLEENSQVPVMRVFLGEEPLYVREPGTETPARLGRTAREVELITRIDVQSAITVPLIARGRALGVMTFAACSPGRYSEEDLSLAEELARRAATAIDHAQVYKEAEERAQAAEALAFIAEGVALLDRDAVVRLWNPAAAAITGLETDQVLGRTLQDVMPGWAAVEQRVPTSDESPTTAVSLPVEIDGREAWLSIVAAPFPGGVVYAFRDITHERELERVKSEFVSTISHELRTPLAAVYGAALTLSRGDSLGRQSHDELISLISSEGERLARIIDEVQWASRLDTGTLSVEIEQCDPVLLAADQVEAHRTHLPRGFELELAALDGIPSVAADPAKLRQVLGNLLDNAVKYSPAGGHVELRVEHALRCVRFSVRDEGIGVPTAERERIFEKFYRLDPELTRGVGGTGLGLYICRELVHRMDGRIWVKPGDERGSIFIVELPVATTGRPVTPAARA
jgi:two-component system phosphate regulon sensor histidine kinase PhoR